MKALLVSTALAAAGQLPGPGGAGQAAEPWIRPAAAEQPYLTDYLRRWFGAGAGRGDGLDRAGGRPNSDGADPASAERWTGQGNNNGNGNRGDGNGNGNLSNGQGNGQFGSNRGNNSPGRSGTGSGNGNGNGNAGSGNGNGNGNGR
ncbi:hypothetical protein [Geminicoccus flavidas]|uniref:hypothetical protein n=1 Tax=Geminicoccus flavidas TaxID=2506407 RepID=UPI00135A8B7F|nr:hypothetical protein [Geminicoccus flavidas]